MAGRTIATVDDYTSIYVNETEQLHSELMKINKFVSLHDTFIRQTINNLNDLQSQLDKTNNVLKEKDNQIKQLTERLDEMSKPWYKKLFNKKSK